MLSYLTFKTEDAVVIINGSLTLARVNKQAQMTMNFQCLSTKLFFLTFKTVEKSDCMAGSSCGTRVKVKIL